MKNKQTEHKQIKTTIINKYKMEDKQINNKQITTKRINIGRWEINKMANGSQHKKNKQIKHGK